MFNLVKRFLRIHNNSPAQPNCKHSFVVRCLVQGGMKSYNLSQRAAFAFTEDLCHAGILKVIMGHKIYAVRNSLHMLRPMWDTSRMGLYIVILHETLHSI
jgi:hypothetical protein